MNLQESLAYFKALAGAREGTTGAPELAEALGISRSAVWQWRKGIPIDRQCQIEVITQGALVADREQLARIDADNARDRRPA
jgi:biotin operon repressor